MFIGISILSVVGFAILLGVVKDDLKKTIITSSPMWEIELLTTISANNIIMLLAGGLLTTLAWKYTNMTTMWSMLVGAVIYCVAYVVYIFIFQINNSKKK